MKAVIPLKTTQVACELFDPLAMPDSCIIQVVHF